jgi:hypothetical protein
VILKIKINIPDDRVYRNSYSPYDIREAALAADIDAAVRDALDAMQRVDMREADAVIVQHDGDYTDRRVGRLKVRLSDPE